MSALWIHLSAARHQNSSRRNSADRSICKGGEVSRAIRYRHDSLHFLRHVRGSLSRAGDFFAQRLRYYRFHPRGHGASQGETARNRRSDKRRRINWIAAAGGGAVAVILLIQIGVTIRHFGPARQSFPPLASAGGNDVRNIGWLLFSNDNLPFEILGVLVLVATIGVVLLSKRAPR